MASIQRRGDSYRAEVRLRGYPPQRKSFPTAKLARDWARKLEGRILDRRHFVSAGHKKTIADLIDRFDAEVLIDRSDAEKLRHYLGFWREELGAVLLPELTRALVIAAKGKLSRREVRAGKRIAPATINRYHAALSLLLNQAVEWEWLQASPIAAMKRAKEPAGVVRYLSDDERTRLLAECKASSQAMLYPAVLLSLATGMRYGEQFNLKWADVDLGSGAAILHKTKNGERRRVPITGPALDELREYGKIRRLDSIHVFPSLNGQRGAEIRRAFETALRAAKVSAFRWHDLRHTFASYLAMSGATLMEIAEALGHKTLVMVKRYAHLSDSHVSSVVERMTTRRLVA